MNDCFERECRILATQYYRIGQSFQALADDLRDLRESGSVSPAMGDESSETQPKGSIDAERRPLSALRGALRDAHVQTGNERDAESESEASGTR